MASSERSLVMGVAAGYTAEQVLPFLRSLRSTAFAGRIVLFVSRMDDRALASIHQLADEVIGLDEQYGVQLGRTFVAPLARTLRLVRITRRVRRVYPTLFRLMLAAASNSQGKGALWRDLERDLEGFQSLRYFHYLDYLRNRAMEADMVMLSDVRDVVFQQDPFSEPLHCELEVFLESNHVKVGNNAFNRRWIRTLYGARMANQMGEEVVSCSGTTVGTRCGVLRYLECVCAEIEKQRRPLGAHDQGIHNYLIRNNRLAPLSIRRNGEGRILTVGEQVEVKLSQSDEVLNHDGRVVPVVHQYDRHPALATLLWQRYAG